MKNYINILKNTKLFSGIEDHDIEAMLNCLSAKLKHYEKDEYVFRAGENIKNVMMLVDGKLHIQTDDYWGYRSIINAVEIGEMFGEAFVTPDNSTTSHDVVAVENSTVILFDINKLLTVCSSACRFHTLTIQNLFFIVAEKSRKLADKLSITSKRTTREKLIAYLSQEAKQQKKSTFEIQFNRQQLADFLSVDRSAMSNELCKMRDDGMIKFHKNKFSLYDI